MINKVYPICSRCGEQRFFENLIWLSSKEAADYLRISVGALRNRVYRGEIIPRKFGRLNRYNKKELAQLLGAS